MHYCPNCHQVCHCDGEDVLNDYASKDCQHVCLDENYDDFIDSYLDDFDDPDDDLEDAIANCYMGPGGYCGAAGSEYCDWECPFNR